MKSKGSGTSPRGSERLVSVKSDFTYYDEIDGADKVSVKTGAKLIEELSNAHKTVKIPNLPDQSCDYAETPQINRRGV